VVSGRSFRESFLLAVRQRFFHEKLRAGNSDHIAVHGAPASLPPLAGQRRTDLSWDESIRPDSSYVELVGGR
jgi:hypothetical protein